MHGRTRTWRSIDIAVFKLFGYPCWPQACARYVKRDKNSLNRRLHKIGQNDKFDNITDIPNEKFQNGRNLPIFPKVAIAILNVWVARTFTHDYNLN